MKSTATPVPPGPSRAPRSLAAMAGALVALSACLIEETPGFGDRRVTMMVVDTAAGAPFPLTDGRCVGTLWTRVSRTGGDFFEADTVPFDQAPAPPANGGGCSFVDTTDARVGEGEYLVELSAGVGTNPSLPVWSASCSFTHVEAVDIVLVATYRRDGCVRITD